MYTRINAARFLKVGVGRFRSGERPVSAYDDPAAAAGNGGAA